MTTPDTLPLLNNSQADRIADVLTELSRLIQWVGVDGQEAEFISYWQQSAIHDLTSFKAELRANRDLIGPDVGQLRVYAHILRDTITRPANALGKQIKQWLHDNPNRSNTMAVLLNPFLKSPTPDLKPDSQSELRQTLTQLQGTLTELRKTITDVTRPLFNAMPIFEDAEENSKTVLASTPAHSERETEPLSHAKICLIRIYNQEPITKTNAQDIAVKYGHDTPNAGRVLLRKYDELDDETKRLGHRDIESHIEAVKPLLTTEGLQRAENDLDKIHNKRR